MEFLFEILQYLLFFLPFLAVYQGDGSGTVEDPYLVETPAQFNDIRDDTPDRPNKVYRLENNIDLTFDTQDPSGAFYNGGLGMAFMFELGGNADLVIDMNYFDVIGMKIARNVDRCSLFPRFDGTIRNGRWVDCIIESTGTRIGVIYGGKRNASVIQNVGIINPTVSGGSSTGAMGGEDSSTTGIQDSYVLGGSVSAEGTNIVCGFSGKNADSPFTRCWASIPILGTSTQKHGFTNNANNVSNCYWDTDVGHGSSTGGAPRTTLQLQSLSNYGTYDMVALGSHDGQEATAIWAIDEGNAYPVLWFEVGTDNLPKVTVYSDVAKTIPAQGVYVRFFEVDAIIANNLSLSNISYLGDATTTNVNGTALTVTIPTEGKVVGAIILDSNYDAGRNAGDEWHFAHNIVIGRENVDLSAPV